MSTRSSPVSDSSLTSEPSTRSSLMYIKEKLYQRSMRMSAPLSAGLSSCSSSSAQSLDDHVPGEPNTKSPTCMESASSRPIRGLAFGVETILSSHSASNRTPPTTTAKAETPAVESMSEGEAHKYPTPPIVSSHLTTGSVSNNISTTSVSTASLSAAAFCQSALTAAYYSNLSKNSWSSMINDPNNNNNNTTPEGLASAFPPSLYGPYGLSSCLLSNQAAHYASGNVFDPMSFFVSSNVNPHGVAHSSIVEPIKTRCMETAKEVPCSISSQLSSTASAVLNTQRKRTWSRAVFSSLQRRGLESRFMKQKYITKPDRKQLAAALGLSDAQVKVWFQNRRMKWRHSTQYLQDIRKVPETEIETIVNKSMVLAAAAVVAAQQKHKLDNTNQRRDE